MTLRSRLVCFKHLFGFLGFDFEVGRSHEQDYEEHWSKKRKKKARKTTGTDTKF